ncbi:ABC transporter ATP-binding protein [Paenibacillus sp. PAMC21692]|uniref:ABC transporter ATP-binding protein n=1 Tax=Paenibacillus sp. PAMC21692 TaxID=2762320 RepID=UPI00164D3171|nr:ABC transporter ATP-binding protein [Paenibacillus sp. PAMC21692]QNK56273.1 ABC transporter ATP-binding protein [Paenibacillus sp. PAMC21692]
MDSQRILADFFRKTWLYYVLSISLHLIASIVHVNFPRVLGNFTDELKEGVLTLDSVIQYSWILLAIGAGYAIIGGFAQYLVMYTGRFFEFMNRRKLFIHFAGLSERFYSRNGVGKLLSYFMNDVTAVRESISMGVNQTAGASMLLISTVVMLLLTDVPLYLVAASIFPLLLIPVVVAWFGPMIKKRSMGVQEALGAMTESAEEQFGGIRVTKKFAVEEVMGARFGVTVDRIRSRQLSLVRVSSFFQSLVPFLGATSLIIALAFGGYLTINGTITLGGFVALTLYIRMLMNPLQQIGNVINVVQRARASLERLNNLLSQRPDITEDDEALGLDSSSAGIEVRGLTFAYGEPETTVEGERDMKADSVSGTGDKKGRSAVVADSNRKFGPGGNDLSGELASREVLRDINLSVAPGTTLGIIGRTGSGKTTLMKLLLRTYDPPPGTIWIGGEDVRRLSLKSLREGIAYVPQDGFLFSSTIRENIAFYKRDSELAEVERAAKLARVYDNIIEFPEKFETRLGERGVTLSGGQRQRTSLARGIIKDAPILVLDDSVSAVDAVTETEIMETIREIRRGKTTIVIAHRISALKHADAIVVMDGGAIVERGTHEELLARNGLYRTLHDIQEEGTMRNGAGH